MNKTNESAVANLSLPGHSIFGTAPTAAMPELTELLARLRNNEIDIPAFLREAEKLSDDEWRKLSALIMQWFGQQKPKA